MESVVPLPLSSSSSSTTSSPAFAPSGAGIGGRRREGGGVVVIITRNEFEEEILALSLAFDRLSAAAVSTDPSALSSPSAVSPSVLMRWRVERSDPSWFGGDGEAYLCHPPAMMTSEGGGTYRASSSTSTPTSRSSFP